MSDAVNLSEELAAFTSGWCVPASTARDVIRVASEELLEGSPRQRLAAAALLLQAGKLHLAGLAMRSKLAPDSESDGVPTIIIRTREMASMSDGELQALAFGAPDHEGVSDSRSQAGLKVRFAELKADARKRVEAMTDDELESAIAAQRLVEEVNAGAPA